MSLSPVALCFVLDGQLAIWKGSHIPVRTVRECSARKRATASYTICWPVGIHVDMVSHFLKIET